VAEEHQQPIGNSSEKKKDEVVVDFSQWKQKVKNFWKGEKKTEHSAQPKDRSDEVNIAKLGEAFRKHAKWVLPLICILLAMTVSIYFRTMPLRLPITESWAENNVYNFYRSQISQQVEQQYPNLPPANVDALIAKEWQTFSIENEKLLTEQSQTLAEQYRNQFRNEQGTMYLLGIDPYYYYRQTEYILNNGFPGSEIKEGVLWDSYRLAPIGREAEWNLHNWFGAQWHRILNWFGDYPLLFTFFLVGTVFSALTIIPGFFIGKIITKNNVGGFFTAMLLAVSSFFVARTTGESSDTDVYAVFFPVLITWLFLESFEATKLKHKMIWIALAGSATGLFAFAWTGWWYIASFIVPAMVVQIIYLCLLHRKTLAETVKSEVIRHPFYLLVTYVTTTGVFVSILNSFREFTRVALGPFQFLRLKAVAVTSYWPNIRTTVAELNVPSFTNVLEQLGGKLFFALAIVGIVFTLLKKDEQGKRSVIVPFFLGMWMISSLFATTKGIRFILQTTPVFAIAFGAFLGITWHYASVWISRELKIPKKITMIIIFLLLALLLVEPVKSGYSQAFNSVPSMHDGWYNTLTKIKNEAPENIIITSWWDFGHWFKAIANRPVTFDGGTQVGWGAHWVGKALLSHDEKATVGIIRMLNCGQNSAFEELDTIWNDTPREIDLLNEIIVLDKEAAALTLQQEGLTASQTETILKYTHCDAPADFFITSEDMVGKGAVWGHFGSWDFDKAVMYQKAKQLSREEAVAYFTSTFNLSPETAAQYYSEIQSTEADKWIAPWPGYLSGLNSCQNQADNSVTCDVGTQQGTVRVEIDLSRKEASIRANTNDIFHPQSFVYADREGVHEQKYTNNTVGFSAILIPNGENYQMLAADPLHGFSTFTKLFFLDGHGTTCFTKFDESAYINGGKIITWIIDYDCQQERQVYFLPQEEVRAAHILISTDDKTEEEALALVKEIEQNLTKDNFADYARKYSQDPGSKDNGGALGWFGKGVMVPEFEQTAFALLAGEISEPVKTQFGYHLIIVEEKRVK